MSAAAVLRNFPDAMNALLQASATATEVAEASEKVTFCNCGRCSNRSRGLARQCCRETKGRCALVSVNFGIDLNRILSEDVVRVAMNLERNVAWEENWQHNNKSLRHQAYRQFVYFVAGTTGLRNRLIVPSCIAWRIRKCWPDPDNTYKDFVASTGTVLRWTCESGLINLRGPARATLTLAVASDDDEAE